MKRSMHRHKELGLIVLFLILGTALLIHNPVSASTTITVNSNADTVPADDGVCTLREAIVASNTDTTSGATPGECLAGSGSDVINFAITGVADFTSNSQDGYTITLGSDLPAITESVVINGYSQPGALANSVLGP